MKLWLSLIPVCIVGAMLAEAIPVQWKYLFGYAVGALISMLLDLPGRRPVYLGVWRDGRGF